MGVRDALSCSQTAISRLVSRPNERNKPFVSLTVSERPFPRSQERVRRHALGDNTGWKIRSLHTLRISEKMDSIRVPGHWVRMWHNQFICMLGPMLAREECRRNVVDAYELLANCFARLDGQ